MASKPLDFALSNPAAYDGAVPIYNLSQLLKFKPPSWLIEGLVPHEAMVGLAGPPGVGKSMLALDWGLSVATGQPWLGHVTDPGFVLYIAAEGHSGLSIRAKAWVEAHKIHPARVPFGLVKGRITIQTEQTREGDYDTLFKRIDEELTHEPKLVIIDTLARCLDGDENTNEGMGSFLDGAERLIDRYKSTVLVLHHKNAAGTKERGHTSFRGTLGSLFFFEPVPRDKTGLLVLKNEKQRDAREAAHIYLKMSEVGDSAMLAVADAPATQHNDLVARASAMRTQDMIKLLHGREEGLSWSEWFLLSGLSKSQFARRIKKLTDESIIYKDQGRYYLVPSSADLAALGEDE